MQSPTVVAPMTATLSRLSKGRQLIDFVTGGDTVENKGDGIFLSHSQHCDITRELIEIYMALMTRHS
jgi:alkanesulfonate monooxygenase